MKSNFKVPFIKPTFPSSELIAKDYNEIVENNWFTNFGPFEQRFRREVAEYVGDDVSVCTVANATLGLSIATSALFEKKEGSMNHVLVPSFTFAAGPEVLIANGYTPVFIDIDSSTQPNIQQASEFIRVNRPTMAGILLCNTYGIGNTEIGEWEELANQYGMPLIINSAAGFGSEYESGKKLGTRGDCEVFSLHAFLAL